MDLFKKTDTELVQSILQKGSEYELLLLVKRHEQSAYNLALKMTGTKEEAEEICQDAFVKSFQDLKHLVDPGKYKAWLLSIVYRKSIDRLRLKKRYFTDLDDSLLVSENQAFEDWGSFSDERISSALSHLSELDRGMITLHYLEGYAVKEIAEMMNLRESNVKVRMMRARNLLKEQMTKKHVNDEQE